MLKFILKKKNDGSILEVGTFENVSDGEQWIERITLSGKYGLNNNIWVLEDELSSHNLKKEDASFVGVSDSPKLDKQGNLIKDENSKVLLQNVYHFEKAWEVEIVDITNELTKESKIKDRSQIRQNCLRIIDMIATFNELAPSEKMSQIFGTPQMMGITLALLTGAPKTAKSGILALGPSLYSAEQVAEIVAELDKIIGA